MNLEPRPIGIIDHDADSVEKIYKIYQDAEILEVPSNWRDLHDEYYANHRRIWDDYRKKHGSYQTIVAAQNSREECSLNTQEIIQVFKTAANMKWVAKEVSNAISNNWRQDSGELDLRSNELIDFLGFWPIYWGRGIEDLAGFKSCRPDISQLRMLFLGPSTVH